MIAGRANEGTGQKSQQWKYLRNNPRRAEGETGPASRAECGLETTNPVEHRASSGSSRQHSGKATGEEGRGIRVTRDKQTGECRGERAMPKCRLNTWQM